MLSIIIPVLNEGAGLEDHLQRLQALRQTGCELIGVDGGSSDNSPHLLEQYCDQALHCEKGRARQMNHGARHAQHPNLLFLHADTVLPNDSAKLISKALENADWGRFDVTLSNQAFIYRLTAFLMNHRSRLTQVATGDQCLFFSRDFFTSIDGFPDIALMEDVAISKRARQNGIYAPLKTKVVTSARRWEKNGAIRTILLMWWLRLRYFMGSSPDTLARIYYG